MTLTLKRACLAALYNAYDEAIGRFSFACGTGCSRCCTRNVLATSLEADLLLESLEASNRRDLIDRAVACGSAETARPELSPNRCAALCMAKQGPPDPRDCTTPGMCPFLEEAGCPVYAARPFECRAMWSQTACSGGSAAMDPLLITINLMFRQLVEDLDSGGLYGNVLDLIAYFRAPDNRARYRSGCELHPVGGLVRTEPNPGLLVPPEHRGLASAIMSDLWNRPVQGMPFKDARQSIRTS